MTHPGKGVSALEAVAVEALMTAALVTVIIVFLSHKRMTRLTPLAVWPLVSGCVWRAALVSGASLNPARSWDRQ